MVPTQHTKYVAKKQRFNTDLISQKIYYHTGSIEVSGKKKEADSRKSPKNVIEIEGNAKNQQI